MEIYINNKLISQSNFLYNDSLNFNRLYNDLNFEYYTIKVDKDIFIEKLEVIYEEVKKEIKKDDLKHNDTSDFSKTNYCNLKTLLTQEKYLYEIFNNFLRDTFFNDFTNQNATSIINSVDTVMVNEKIIIRGKIFIKK